MRNEELWFIYIYEELSKKINILVINL